MSRERTGKANAKRAKVSRPSMLATAMAVFGAALAGCASTQPVNRPCGVITDPLGDVQATTREGNQRIDAHFERGVRAGCWDRPSGPGS